MKANNKGVLIFSAMVVLGTMLSCMPDENERISTGYQGNIEELKANAGFDWATAKTTVVNVSGLTGFSGEIMRRLNLTDAEDNLYYSGFHSISEDVEISLELPHHVKSLNLKFGNIEKQDEIKGGKVNFDYLPEVDNSDIQ